MGSVSPTQRALAELRELGYTHQKVEFWNQFSRRRVDLFGFIDILAITPELTIGIQVTAGSGHAARRKKILGHPLAVEWLRSPYRAVEVWSFRKVKVKRGGRQTRWALRRERLHPSQLSSTALPTPAGAASDSESGPSPGLP
jgi:hypothetical protein